MIYKVPAPTFPIPATAQLVDSSHSDANGDPVYATYTVTLDINEIMMYRPGFEDSLTVKRDGRKLTVSFTVQGKYN